MTEENTTESPNTDDPEVTSEEGGEEKSPLGKLKDVIEERGYLEENRAGIRILGDGSASLKTGVSFHDNFNPEFYAELNPAESFTLGEHNVGHRYQAGLIGVQLDGVNSATRGGFIDRNVGADHFSDVFEDHRRTDSILGGSADFNIDLSENSSFSTHTFAGISLDNNSPTLGALGIYSHQGENSSSTLGVGFGHLDGENRLDIGLTHQRELGKIFEWEARLLAEVEATFSSYDRNNIATAHGELELLKHLDNGAALKFQGGATAEFRDNFSSTDLEAYAKLGYRTADGKYIVSGKAWLEEIGNADPRFNAEVEITREITEGLNAGIRAGTDGIGPVVSFDF